MYPNAPYCRLVHTRARRGSFVAMPCTARCDARRAARLRACAARGNPFPEPSVPGFAVLISRSVCQAEEAVASLQLRLAVRVHCGPQV
jgi:hypothetical protein